MYGGAGRLGPSHRVVSRSAVDYNYVIYPFGSRTNRLGDTLALVQDRNDDCNGESWTRPTKYNPRLIQHRFRH